MTVITIGVSVLLAALVNSLPPCYKKRLTDYLEINKLISFNQGGFSSGYTTTDHIFILINKYLHKLKSKLYVCFVDFKKVFDSINRNALFQKIENKGIGGNFLKLIKDMYSNTLYSCKFGNSYSEPFFSNPWIIKLTYKIYIIYH